MSSDIISVEANVATAFNLRTYDTMIMNIVDPASVALDSVEITFKDQYMGRSEMWRLKSFLVSDLTLNNQKKNPIRWFFFSNFVRQIRVYTRTKKLNIVPD